MSKNCCHPALIWLLNFLLIISIGIVCFILLFTTFTSRPTHLGPRQSLGLNLAEKCTIAHLAFTIFYGIILQTAFKLLSSGDHRDHRYRIEQDFKILIVLTLLSSLLVLVLGIVVFVNEESALLFPGTTAQEAAVEKSKPPLWYETLTTASKEGPSKLVSRTRNVHLFVVYLLVADIISFVLSLAGTITVLGCNKREQYNVEAAVEAEMLRRSRSRSTIRSARSSRSSSHHTRS